MVIHALACDYDGTIASEGRVDEATATALARVRDSGRKVFLVTGRMLPDLRHVCPALDTMFDAVVAENGAVVYLPARRETRTLGDAPEPALLRALAEAGVRVDVGASIIAGDAGDGEAAAAAIRAAGVERSLVFNKGSLMLLPGGVNKGTGLTAVLDVFGMSSHTLAGVGDGENDHAFLAMCECAVAVGDSVAALAERADVVARAPGPAGARAFIAALLADEAAAVAAALARHQLELGRTTEGDGAVVTLPAHGTGLLVVGPTGTGKSTVTGLLIERLLDAKRTFCVVDPEGDYQSLADTPAVVVLGGKAEQALPRGDELGQLVARTHASVVLNLSAMTLAEKIDYAAVVLATVGASRAASGLPIWLVVDEAHHVFPAEGSPAVELLGAGTLPVCLTTLSVDHLAPAARALINTVASTDPDGFDATMSVLARDRQVSAPWTSAPPLALGEVALARLDDGPPTTVRVRLAPRHVHHRRHLRKYTEGELPPERSFYFRGPEGRLNLRAANLVRFRELAEGIDDDTWAHHARRGEYSAWLREMIKDADLADEVAAIERVGASRRDVLDAIRRRYAV